jgi:hypothetical protein
MMTFLLSSISDIAIVKLSKGVACNSRYYKQVSLRALVSMTEQYLGDLLPVSRTAWRVSLVKLTGRLTILS